MNSRTRKSIHAAVLSAFLCVLPLGAAVAVIAAYVAYAMVMVIGRTARGQRVASYTRDFLDRLSDESRNHG